MNMSVGSPHIGFRCVSWPVGSACKLNTNKQPDFCGLNGMTLSLTMCRHVMLFTILHSFRSCIQLAPENLYAVLVTLSLLLLEFMSKLQNLAALRPAYTDVNNAP